MSGFRCELCEEWIEHPDTDNVMDAISFGEDHFRVFHPDVYEQIGRWADGEPAVLDESLEPADFEARG